MDEGEYREAYHEFNPLRCIFEKSILSRQTMCEHAHRFCLADREGVACQRSTGNNECMTLLDQLRTKAIFALKLTRIEGPLAHAKELRVQTGGILGLNQIISGATTPDTTVNNIYALIEQAKHKFGDLASLPFDEITRAIVQFEGRASGRRGKR